MSVRYRFIRSRCRCRRCPRCRSKLSDNYSDAECEAYLWLIEHGVAGWMCHNPSGMVIEHATKRTTDLVTFAREKGMPNGPKPVS